MNDRFGCDKLLLSKSGRAERKRGTGVTQKRQVIGRFCCHSYSRMIMLFIAPSNLIHSKHENDETKARWHLIYLIFKRNANAFSLIAIVHVRLLLRRHEMIVLISQKLLKLATSKFNAA